MLTENKHFRQRQTIAHMGRNMSGINIMKDKYNPILNTSMGVRS